MKTILFSIIIFTTTLLISCSSVSLTNEAFPSSTLVEVNPSSSDTRDLPLFQVTPNTSEVKNSVGFHVQLSRLQYTAEGIPIRLLREQIDGEWRYVDQNNHVLPYDEMRKLYQTNAAIVRIHNRYGLVNGNYEEILPVEYDMIVQVTSSTVRDTRYPVASFIYFMKDDRWYSADVSKGIVLEFSATTDNTADYYFEDFMVTVNTQYPQEIQSFQYYGTKDDIAVEMLLPGFDGSTFQIYEPTGVCIATKTAKLTYGAYADTMFLDLNAAETNTVAVSENVSVLSLQPKCLEELSPQIKEAINYDANRMDILEVYHSEETQQYFISMVTSDVKQNPIYTVLLVDSNDDSHELFQQIYSDTRFPATLSLMLVVSKQDRLEAYYVLSDMKGCEYHTFYIEH